MPRKMIILLSMAFISLSTAQQISLGENSDRWWFFAVPTRNVSVSFSNLNPKDSEPVVKRDDYTHTEGVGAHKVHTRPAAGWNMARKTCSEEGGHLAIVNSVAEANVIGNLLVRANLPYAFIGFHDYFEEGDYLTLDNQSLAKAGYTYWAPGQPDAGPREHCGGLDKTGKLHDVICDEHTVFVCELSVE